MSEIAEAGSQNHVALTADIVAAYMSNNHVVPTEVAELIATVHAAVAGLAVAKEVVESQTKPNKAEIRKSITKDALISFEDGKPYKALRRHLTTRGLSAEAYREKHGLPVEYPMVAASYSEQRSAFAKSIQLGRKRQQQADGPTPAPQSAPAPEASPKSAKVKRNAKSAVAAVKAAPEPAPARTQVKRSVKSAAKSAEAARATAATSPKASAASEPTKAKRGAKLAPAAKETTAAPPPSRKAAAPEPAVAAPQPARSRRKPVPAMAE